MPARLKVGKPKRSQGQSRLARGVQIDADPHCVSPVLRRRLVPMNANSKVQANAGPGIEPAAINTDCSYFAIVRLRSSMFETYPGP